MRRWLRRMFRIPPPRIGREETVEIALAECARKGWGIGECSAQEGLRYWQIWMNSGVRPSPIVIVCQQSGEVVQALCPPR